MNGRQLMQVRIRRDLGLKVRPEAEQIDGKTFCFHFGWDMVDGDRYPGESAWIPSDCEYPADAPPWIASGDLAPVAAARNM